MQESQNKIDIIYDGECPICQAGVKSLCDGKADITKIDKRTDKDNPVAIAAQSANLKIDEGVIIHYQDKFYQGVDALHLASKMDLGKGFVNSIGKLMFRNKTVGKFFYPFLRGTRNILVYAKGVGKIEKV